VGPAASGTNGKRVKRQVGPEAVTGVHSGATRHEHELDDVGLITHTTGKDGQGRSRGRRSRKGRDGVGEGGPGGGGRDGEVDGGRTCRDGRLCLLTW